MPLEIRQENLVITSGAGNVPVPALNLNPNETLKASWYVPIDNVGSQLTAYRTINPVVLNGKFFLEIKPVNAALANSSSNPMRVIVFAAVDLPLIHIGEGTLFSDATLQSPENSLVDNDDAYMGIPVTNNSDSLILQSVRLKVNFAAEVFDPARVFLTPLPPAVAEVTNIPPGQTKMAMVIITTSPDTPLNRDFQFTVSVDSIVLDTSVVTKGLLPAELSFHVGEK